MSLGLEQKITNLYKMKVYRIGDLYIQSVA